MSGKNQIIDLIEELSGDETIPSPALLEKLEEAQDELGSRINDLRLEVKGRRT
jgi:hypothetical protein